MKKAGDPMTPPVTASIENQTDSAFGIAKASLEIEGQKLTEDGEALILSHARGEMSDDEFLKRALEIARSV
ncbi:antitoxin VbhA family protein [Paenibacillus pasadenensis]|uniref:antitoxin VbhA family protein n=1 Tax=Paenibacillus pasadenensis TaxID=217090 RepID=UPI0011AEEE70|nr:antitoxin VbhA family protein [Paenibacillus pasadenensis]